MKLKRIFVIATVVLASLLGCTQGKPAAPPKLTADEKLELRNLQVAAILQQQQLDNANKAINAKVEEYMAKYKVDPKKWQLQNDLEFHEAPKPDTQKK